MRRVVKAYDERYTEFLEVAQRLFYTNGYEQTSVQTIIEAVGVAKGTFYHYFDSKADLLDALVKQMLAQSIAALTPIVTDTTMDAHTKFEQMFTRMNNLKLESKEFLLALLQVLYRDDNVLLRTKMQEEALAGVTPLFTAIIEQGVAEGVYTVTAPAETAEIVLVMAQALEQAVSRLLLEGAAGDEVVDGLDRKVAAYERSVERVLGAAAGSLRLVDTDGVRAWFPNGGT